MSPTLVVGVPRSGTSWVATVLSRAAAATYVEEPDNHYRFGFAFRAKYALGQRDYPWPDLGASPEGVRELEALWSAAFGSGRPRRPVLGRIANALVRKAGTQRVAAALAGAGDPPPALRIVRALARPEAPQSPEAPIVVKSVYAALSIEWIAERWRPVVVVVARHPLSVFSSWVELGWLDEGPVPFSTLDPRAVGSLVARHSAPAPSGTFLAHAAWLVGMLCCALDDAAVRNPGWLRVEHESLLAAPHENFPELARSAGLGWSDAGHAALDGLSRAGSGYEIARPPEMRADAWRGRLSPGVLEEVVPVLEAFGRWPLEGATPSR